MPDLNHAEKLAELGNLKENWDSYGGKPPTSEALATAKEFLSELGNSFIAPTPDGGITFEWNLFSGKTVIVDIKSNGETL